MVTNSNIINEYKRQAEAFSNREGLNFTKSQIRIRKARASFVKKYVNKNTKLLDVGCSEGLILRCLAPYIESGIGIDIAQVPIQVAAERTYYDNIKFYNVPMEAFDHIGFDIITSFEVIEHTPDPAFFIEEIKNKLTPNGVIILSTPNFERLDNKILNILGEKKQFADETHTYEFDRKSLKKLLISHGFEVINHTAFCLLPGSFHPMYIINKLLKKNHNRLAYKNFQESYLNIYAGRLLPVISIFQLIVAKLK